MQFIFETLLPLRMSAAIPF